MSGNQRYGFWTGGEWKLISGQFTSELQHSPPPKAEPPPSSTIIDLLKGREPKKPIVLETRPKTIQMGKGTSTTQGKFTTTQSQRTHCPGLRKKRTRDVGSMTTILSNVSGSSADQTTIGSDADGSAMTVRGNTPTPSAADQTKIGSYADGSTVTVRGNTPTRSAADQAKIGSDADGSTVTVRGNAPTRSAADQTMIGSDADGST
ncbi:MAG: hypothetical protein ACREBR_01495, partial [bacterium]